MTENNNHHYLVHLDSNLLRIIINALSSYSPPKDDEVEQFKLCQSLLFKNNSIIERKDE